MFIKRFCLIKRHLACVRIKRSNDEMGCTQIVSFVRSGNDVEKHQQLFNVNFALRDGLSASTDEQCKPFTSRQRIVTRRPGFLWDAQVSMFPGVAVGVVDSYIAGEVASSKIRIGRVSMAYYGR